MALTTHRTFIAGLVTAVTLLVAAANANASGEFTHRVPIRLPSGVQHVQPDLALVYTSEGGNGIVGVGWSLEGLPYITRVNYGRGINYDGLDTYMHSVLGVLTLQPDGSYRTKNDSYRKFSAQGACGDGPCSWKMYEPNGTTVLYGPTSDSRLLRPKSSSARTWGIGRVTDVFGNYYTATYTNDATSGRLYPSSLIYTMSEATPAPTLYRTVQFLYEGRTDTSPNYTQRALEATTQRLKWIVVNSGGSILSNGSLRKYRLDYECGAPADPCSGTMTGRSRLVAVTEFGLSNSSLPPQTFTWQTGSSGWSSTGQLPPTDITTRRSDSVPNGWSNGVVMVDLDGDGRLDILQAFRDSEAGTTKTGAWLNRESGWISSPAFIPPATLYFIARDATYPNGLDVGVRVADVNGDGLPDILATTGPRAFLNNGGSCASTSCAWTSASQWNPPCAFMNLMHAVHDSGCRIVDLNGDGLQDMLRGFQLEEPWGSGRYITYASAWLNNGNGWTATPSYAPPTAFSGQDSGTPNGWDEGLRFADLNGDGKPDLLKAHYNYGTTYTGAWLNTGTGWLSAANFVAPGGSHFAGRDAGAREGWDGGLRVADLNGDSKSDLLWGWYNYGTTYSAAWINNGITWVQNALYAPPLVFAGRKAGVPWGWDAGARVADLNADRRSDLIVGFIDGSTTRRAFLNSEIGWTENSALAPPVPFTGRDSVATRGWDNGVLLDDVLGTGRLAMLQSMNGNRGAWTLTPDRPDLMISATNGIGGAVTVTYASASKLGAISPNLSQPGVSNQTARSLVVRVAVADGRGGVRSTKYDYRNMRWISGPIPEQRNLGFSDVVATDEQTGAISHTQYNQAPTLEGHPALVTDFSSDGQVSSTTSYTYEVRRPAAGTESVLEKTKVQTKFEDGVAYATTTRTTTYDSYGSAVTVLDQAASLPDVITTTTYSNDPVAWVLGRVTGVEVTSGGRVLSSIAYVWSGNAVSSVRRWIDSADTWAETTLVSDGSGNLLKLSETPAADGLTRSTQFSYDVAFNAYPETETDALGRQIRRTFNADGNVSTLTDENMQTTNTYYDVFGRPSRTSMPDGGKILYAYSQYGDPQAQFYGVTTVTRDSWTTDYQATFRREYFDGTGFVYAVQRDADCFSGSVRTYAAIDRVKDRSGRLERESLPYCSGSLPGAHTILTYDPRGRIKTLTGPDGGERAYSYSTAVVNGATYAQVSVRDPNGSTATRQLDAREQTRRVIDAAGRNTDYEYDARLRLVGVTLPNSSRYSASYDSLDRRTSITDPVLGQTGFRYDNASHLLAVVTPRTTVTYSYDVLGRPILKAPAGEAAIRYTYDEPSHANGIGRLTTVVDHSGTTALAYDPLGRVSVASKVIEGQTFTLSYGYDGGGRITGITYPDGSLASYTYNNGANLESVSLNGVQMASWTAFDASGRPGQVSFSNGVQSTMQYDVLGHVYRLTTTSTSLARLQDLTYDWYSRPNTGGIALGSIKDNRAIRTAPDGTNTDESQEFSYDPLYRLTRADGVWGVKNFDYDSVGNMTLVGGVITRTLAYSGLGQQVTSGTGISSVTYDAAGNMLHKSIDGTDWDYAWSAQNELLRVTQNGWPVGALTYDASGMRTKKVYSPRGGATVSTLYVGDLYEKQSSSDGSADLHTLRIYAHGHLVASLTKAGNVQTALLDDSPLRHNLIAASLCGTSGVGSLPHKARQLLGVLGHYAVGRSVFQGIGLVGLAALLLASLGKRGSRQRSKLRYGSAAAALLVFYTSSGCDNGHEVDLRSASVERMSRLLTGDTTRPGVGLFFYHHNQVGSSEVVTNAGGAEVTRYTYLPFGEIATAHSGGTDSVTAKFVGQPYDSEFQLSYLHSRYYDPRMGRFVSADSMVPDVLDAQSFNRYSYALNNPISLRDPSGQEPISAGAIYATVLPGGPAGIAAGAAVVAGVLVYNNWSGISDWTSKASTQVAEWAGSSITQFFDWVGGLFGGGRDHERVVAPGPGPAPGGIVAPAPGPWAGASAGAGREALTPTIQCHGVSAFGFSGNVGDFRVTAIPGSGPRALEGYRLIRTGTELAVDIGSSLVLPGVQTVLRAEMVAARAAVRTAESAETVILRQHIQRAIVRFEVEGFTEKQAVRIATTPRLQAAYRGERIDTFFKQLVRADPRLDHLQITRRFRFGPDVFDPTTHRWWDATTLLQWDQHVVRYEAKFGQGVLLDTVRIP